MLRRIERALTGELPEDVRTNLRYEIIAAMVFGVFHVSTISFLPVVLRRMGATSLDLAIYIAQTYLGSMLTSFTVLLLRGRDSKSFVVTCWLLGRSLFLTVALVGRVGWLLLITGMFWVLEASPAPAYARIVQAIYPAASRGRALAIVRVGMVGALMLVTPLAGWALDRVGYRVLFPLAALAGLLAIALFTRLRIDPAALPPLQTVTLRAVWGIPLHDRRFGRYLVAFVFYGLGSNMGAALYPIVQVDRLQLSYTQLGYLGFAQSLCWLLGYLAWGPLVDRYGGASVLRLNIALNILVPLVYFWAFDGWTIIPAFLAQGLVSAGIDIGLLSAGIALAQPGRVTEYYALQTTVIGIRGMIAPFVGTTMLALGLPDRAVFSCGCVLMLLGWLLMRRVRLDAAAPDRSAETAAGAL